MLVFAASFFACVVQPWCTTPATNIHTPDPSLPPAAMAGDYQQRIQTAFGTTGVCAPVCPRLAYCVLSACAVHTGSLL